MRTCFICKVQSEDAKPIGMAKLRCREIYICKGCNDEMQPPKTETVSRAEQLSKSSTFAHYRGLTKSTH